VPTFRTAGTVPPVLSTVKTFPTVLSITQQVSSGESIPFTAILSRNGNACTEETWCSVFQSKRFNDPERKSSEIPPCLVKSKNGDCVSLRYASDDLIALLSRGHGERCQFAHSSFFEITATKPSKVLVEF
jgi:hypothetical protein